MWEKLKIFLFDNILKGRRLTINPNFLSIFPENHKVYLKSLKIKDGNKVFDWIVDKWLSKGRDKYFSKGVWIEVYEDILIDSDRYRIYTTECNLFVGDLKSRKGLGVIRKDTIIVGFLELSNDTTIMDGFKSYSTVFLEGYRSCTFPENLTFDSLVIYDCPKVIFPKSTVVIYNFQYYKSDFFEFLGDIFGQSKGDNSYSRIRTGPKRKLPTFTWMRYGKEIICCNGVLFEVLKDYIYTKEDYKLKMDVKCYDESTDDPFSRTKEVWIDLYGRLYPIFFNKSKW